MKKYIDSLTYKLKDFKGVKERYKDYKTKKFNELMFRHQATIPEYLLGLSERIKRQFLFGVYRDFFGDLDLDIKIDIRFLYTNINHVCRYENENLMDRIANNPNKNQNECFAVKFYLKYYERLNNIMKDTLVELIEGR